MRASARPPSPDLAGVVLAGGRGTRLSGVLPEVPKPLAPVAGRPFLEWVIAWLASQGVSELAVTTGHLADQFEVWLAGRPPDSVTIRLVREIVPLGTGGAVLNALDEVSKRVLVVNADSLVLTHLDVAFARLDDDDLDGVLLAVAVPDGTRYGVLELDQRRRLRSMGTARAGPQLVNAGVYLFRRRVLATLDRRRAASLENELIPALLRNGAQLGVEPVSAPFLDIGTPESLAEAAAFIRSNASWFD